MSRFAASRSRVAFGIGSLNYLDSFILRARTVHRALVTHLGWRGPLVKIACAQKTRS
jgi:hypothetical protein